MQGPFNVMPFHDYGDWDDGWGNPHRRRRRRFFPPFFKKPFFKKPFHKFPPPYGKGHW